MAITATAPRGGIVEEIDGVTHTLMLRCREIERFEDMHRGIFDVWEGFFGRANKPTSKEVRDIIALALVGGGEKEADAWHSHLCDLNRVDGRGFLLHRR